MATRNENPAPFMAVHPGMMVKPELVERGITQKEFAKMLGIQASHLSEVLNGKRALSTDLAVKIEEVIGLPAKLLLSAQAQYNIESAKATPDDKQHETVASKTATCFKKSFAGLVGSVFSELRFLPAPKNGNRVHHWLVKIDIEGCHSLHIVDDSS